MSKTQIAKSLPSPAPDNGWNKDNMVTIDTWIDSSSQLYFTYDTLADYALDQMQRINVILTIFSSIITVFTYLQLNSDPDSQMSNSFKIILVVLSSATSAINGFSAIKKLQEKVNKYSKFAEKASRFSDELSAQIILPVNFRKNAEKIIVDEQTRYQNLLAEKPNIEQGDYIKITKLYRDCLQGGMLENSKLLAVSQLRQIKKSTSPVNQGQIELVTCE